MTKEDLKALKLKALECAETFSNPDRSRNFANETFILSKIVPLSDVTAAVIFNKEPTGKKALAHFYLVGGSTGGWRYYFVTYQHLCGLDRLLSILQRVEEHNNVIGLEEILKEDTKAVTNQNEGW